MAHNLDRDSMAYVGEAPWHRLGKSVPRGVHAEQMLKAAGLDWTVQMRPARGAKKVFKGDPSSLPPDGTIDPNDRRLKYNRYEIVRLPRDAPEQEILFGVVSDQYQPLQNTEAFRFFDTIVDQKIAFFETAGALGDGERVWVLAEVPGQIEVVPGDSCRRFLLLSNTHGGKGSVVVKFTAVRVVCQNTLLLSMQDGEPMLRLRHSRNLVPRLDEVQHLIASANQVYHDAAELFVAMAKRTLRSDDLDQYLESVYPRSKEQREKRLQLAGPKAVHRLMHECPDLQLNGIRGSLWAAYNAITRAVDHEGSTRGGPEARLERIWFGDGAELKRRALDSAREWMRSN
jgi:phage/plasmid-like protein (TIGR03299 family)